MENLAESLPIYVRIVKGVKDAIVDKKIKEEEQLASTTYLSKEYKINIATVNKAINILVDEGLVYKKRGIGMFIKKGAYNELIEERRQTFKERYIVATLKEAKSLNYTEKELQELVKEAYEAINNEEK